MAEKRKPGRVPPHNIEAEESLLGACLVSRDGLLRAVDSGVRAEHFYKPAHGHIWTAISQLRDQREPVDAVTVADVLRRMQVLEELGGLSGLLELQNAVPAVSGTGRYARIVMDAATLRSLISASSEIAESAYLAPDDVSAALQGARSLLARTEAAHGGPDLVGYWDSMADLDDGSDRDVHQPWVFKGLCRVGQRFMVLAPPGVGKSTILTQAAWCAQNGIHTLTGVGDAPVTRALVCELEGSKWDVIARARIVKRAVAAVCRTDEASLTAPAFLHRQGGLDLGSREGMSALRRAVLRSGAQVVCIGPSKYFGSPDPRENADTHAGRIQDALNGLMDETGCAMMIETHSNRGDPLTPAGSERWKNWPDLGWALRTVGDDDNVSRDMHATLEFVVVPFRRPRDMTTATPDMMIRNGFRAPLPWMCPDHNVGTGRLYDALTTHQQF